MGKIRLRTPDGAQVKVSRDLLASLPFFQAQLERWSPQSTQLSVEVRSDVLVVLLNHHQGMSIHLGLMKLIHELAQDLRQASDYLGINLPSTLCSAHQEHIVLAGLAAPGKIIQKLTWTLPEEGEFLAQTGHQLANQVWCQGLNEGKYDQLAAFPFTPAIFDQIEPELIHRLATMNFVFERIDAEIDLMEFLFMGRRFYPDGPCEHELISKLHLLNEIKIQIESDDLLAMTTPQLQTLSTHLPHPVISRITADQFSQAELSIAQAYSLMYFVDPDDNTMLMLTKKHGHKSDFPDLLRRGLYLEWPIPLDILNEDMYTVSLELLFLHFGEKCRGFVLKNPRLIVDADHLELYAKYGLTVDTPAYFVQLIQDNRIDEVEHFLSQGRRAQNISFQGLEEPMVKLLAQYQIFPSAIELLRISTLLWWVVNLPEIIYPQGNTVLIALIDQRNHDLVSACLRAGFYQNDASAFPVIQRAKITNHPCLKQLMTTYLSWL